MMSVFCDQEDGYDIEYDSDAEPVSSASDDEIDFNLDATKIKQPIKEIEKSGENDFEKQMQSELDETVQNKLKHYGSEACDGHSSSDVRVESKKFYDNIYFDSDSEQENEPVADISGTAKGTEKHPIPSNDDLLYDPNIDDEDQKWVDQQRHKYQNQKKEKLPKSDAVLNCPACMMTLCFDCQRHEKYNNQYRAMFVVNCDVDRTQQLSYPEKDSRRKNKKKKLENFDIISTNNEGIYHPVKCHECKTEVAVMDKEEVFHFFNVLSSYS